MKTPATLELIGTRDEYVENMLAVGNTLSVADRESGNLVGRIVAHPTNAGHYLVTLAPWIGRYVAPFDEFYAYSLDEALEDLTGFVGIDTVVTVDEFRADVEARVRRVFYADAV